MVAKGAWLRQPPALQRPATNRYDVQMKKIHELGKVLQESRNFMQRQEITRAIANIGNEEK